MKRNRWIGQKLLEIGALIIRDQDHLFTWASGIRSPIYCDNRLSLSIPELRDTIAQAFLVEMEGLGEVDVIVGTATAGIAHAAFLAQKALLPMAYVRASQKDHGRQNKIEGIIEAGDRVVVIEDLISTGKSSLAVVDALREAGADVLGVLSIFHYGFAEATEAFKEAGIIQKSLLYYRDILPMALELDLIDEASEKLLAKFAEDPWIFTP